MKKLLVLFLCAWPLLFVNSPVAAPYKAALLYNYSTGKILYQYNAETGVAPASLTKIMTAYLTMDAVKKKKISLNHKVKISQKAARAGGSSMGLVAGERTPVSRLMAGLAVASGNDAAAALAEAVGGSQANFVAQMNAAAAKLGMKRTVFKNPAGLPAAGQKTSAADLLKLCVAYLNRHPEASRFHKMLYLMHKGKVERNTNPLLGTVKGVDGLKTGWTISSGYNIVVTAKRGSTRLIAIVLGGKSRADRDLLASRLIRAGFDAPNNPALARKFIDGRPAKEQTRVAAKQRKSSEKK